MKVKINKGSVGKNIRDEKEFEGLWDLRKENEGEMKENSETVRWMDETKKKEPNKWKRVYKFERSEKMFWGSCVSELS